MTTRISICHGGSCTSLGSAALFRDIEELAHGQCAVDQCDCLGRCGNGPNVEIETAPGRRTIFEGIKSFSNTLDLLQDEAECKFADEVVNVARLKYEIRRETHFEEQAEKLQKAFHFLGTEAAASQAEPMLFSSLLVLRSQVMLKRQRNAALHDAQQAAALAPTWGQARLSLAAALEACGRYSDGVATLQAALELGTGINPASVKRQLKRLQRFATERGDQVLQAETTPAQMMPAQVAPAKNVPAKKWNSGKTRTGKGSCRCSSIEGH